MVIPLGDHNPVRSTPVVTWLLILANVLVFVVFTPWWAGGCAQLSFYAAGRRCRPSWCGARCCPPHGSHRAWIPAAHCRRRARRTCTSRSSPPCSCTEDGRTCCSTCSCSTWPFSATTSRTGWGTSAICSSTWAPASSRRWRSCWPPPRVRRRWSAPPCAPAAAEASARLTGPYAPQRVVVALPVGQRARELVVLGRLGQPPFALIATPDAEVGVVVGGVQGERLLEL